MYETKLDTSALAWSAENAGISMKVLHRISRGDFHRGFRGLLG